MRRGIAALGIVMLGASAAAAQNVSISSVNVDDNDHRIVYVTFRAPFPNGADVLARRYWRLLETDTNGVAHDRDVEGVAITTCDGIVGGPGMPSMWLASCPSGQLGAIALQLSAPIAIGKKASRSLIYGGPAGLITIASDSIHVPTSGGTEAQPAVTAAKSDDADIYFNGTYTAVINGDNSYNIDAYAGYMWTLVPTSPTIVGRVGFYGQAKTKDSPTADPDSYLGYFVYQRVLGSSSVAFPFQSPYLNFRLAGWEFDKKGQQRNFVVSPVVTLPVLLTRNGLLGPLAPGLSRPHATLQIGAEFVRPQKSALETIGDWHARWLLGATVAGAYKPERPWFDSLKVTGSYQVRFLSSAEVFTDPSAAPIDPSTGKPGDPVQELGTQARHSVDVTTTYNVTKWVGVSFEYTYGSTPPVFVITDHSFTVGVTLSLAQTSYGRYSILRP